MYSLTFDTTTNAVSVGLFKSDTPISIFEKSLEFGQAEVLLSAIQNILKTQALNFSELSLVTVCTGPGSFTGVRASLALARAFGLAYPTLKLCGVSAFEAYAKDFKPEECADINAVLIETKRDDFYVQYYDSALQKLAPPEAASYTDILKRLHGQKVSLSGDAPERFLSRPGGLNLHALKLYQKPPIQSLALCGIRKFAAQKTDYPKPLYIKAPDICIK